MLEKAIPHPKYGYLQINTEIALSLTAEEFAKLWPAQRAFIRRVRRQAGLPDLVAGELILELKTQSPVETRFSGPAEMLKEFRAWVAAREWRFAKTMWWCPHEYTVTQLDAPTAERFEFEGWVAFIREHGTKERFGKNRYVKLELDGWKYWSMGWPVNQTILINRARLDAVVLERPPKPEMTLLTPKLKPSRRMA